MGGRFVIERLLGEGGMGAVYAAREVNTSDRVALKIIHAELALTQKEHLTRFIHETLAAALVNHPNVVRSLGAFDDEDGRPVLVLELLDGTSLDRVIHRGPMPTAQAVRIALQASEGIAAVHAKGIVHRDLKPANIFLTSAAGSESQVKVLDFGVALLQGPLADPGAARQTDHGILLGTLDYMAPEQLENARAADQRSDVYALGAILYEMLAGRVPFRAETDPMLVVQIMSSPPTPLSAYRPDIPAELLRVVERAMAKAPKERYQSMGELASALRPFARERVQPPSTPPLPPAAKRKLWQWITVAVIAAVLLTVALLR